MYNHQTLETIKADGQGAKWPCGFGYVFFVVRKCRIKSILDVFCDTSRIFMR